MFQIGDKVSYNLYPDIIGEVERISQDHLTGVDVLRVKVISSSEPEEVGHTFSDPATKFTRVNKLHKQMSMGAINSTIKDKYNREYECQVKSEEPRCICTGHTLLHKGCKCGAVKPRKWGLGA